MKFIIAQAFGFSGVILTFISYQCKSRKSLIALQTASIVAMIIQYLLLGATTGFTLNIICMIRNIAFYFKDKKPLGHPAVPYIFSVIIGIIGSFSWNGYYSILIIAALMINTVFLSGSPQALRKSILLTSTLILIYDIFTLAFGGALNEIVAITSSIIGIYRFRKAKE